MWKITKDNSSQVGVKTPDFQPQKAKYQFRLLDERGIAYLYGRSCSCSDERAFLPLKYYNSLHAHSKYSQIEYLINNKWVPADKLVV